MTKEIEREKMAIYRLRREARRRAPEPSEGTKTVNPLVLHFWPPEPWGVKFLLFKPPDVVLCFNSFSRRICWISLIHSNALCWTIQKSQWLTAENMHFSCLWACGLVEVHPDSRPVGFWSLCVFHSGTGSYLGHVLSRKKVREMPNANDAAPLKVFHGTVIMPGSIALARANHLAKPTSDRLK